MRLVLASNNRKKLAELQAVLAPAGVELIAQSAFAIGEADEPHATFVENALAKARHASALSGLPAVADDSGLCVDALGGAPGVRSARYAPDVAVPVAAEDREARRARQDAANNRHLLAQLDGIVDRRGRFVATLVAVRSAADPEPLVAVGRWFGSVLDAPRGTGGFGYDPLMYFAELDRTAAELPADAKNALSHRALAARQLLEAMRVGWAVT